MNLEPILALIELAGKLEDQICEGDGAYPQDYHDVHSSAVRALPALSQLLEAVTNLEKLEAEWRAKQAVYLKSAKRNAQRGNTGLAHELSMSASDVGGFADDLKRLLHPEDK